MQAPPAPPHAEVRPFVPADRVLPEFTAKAAILGVVLALVLGAANMYVGLRVGLTVSASIPAAVMSMGILRLFRDSNILENNIVQTIAASGQSVAAGLIFTVPALLIVTDPATNAPLWGEVRVLEVLLIALAGGVLGVLFTVPLRRAFVVETKLAYPEGVACAEVLKAGERGGRGSRILFGALLVGAAFAFLQLGLRLWRESVDGAVRAGQAVFGAGMNLAPILVAVGYIVGFRVGALLVAGSLYAWALLIPAFMLAGGFGAFVLAFATLGAAVGWRAFEKRPALAAGAAAAGAVVVGLVAWFALPLVASFSPAVPYTEAAGEPLGYAQGVWSQKIRLVGGGAMIVGGLYTLWKTRESLARTFRMARAAKTGAAGERPRTERDLPFAWVGLAILAMTIPLGALFFYFTRDVVQTLAVTVLMGLAGFFFSAVAGYMAGLVGSSNNPISGVTILTLVTASLLLLALGAGGGPGILAALGVGAVICVAGAIAGDTLQDLKTGQLVGSTPWKQQLAQALGAVSFAFVAALVLQLLVDAYGIAGVGGNTTGLLAPQAFLMSRILTGLFGGTLDVSLLLTGMVLAVALILLRQPVMAVAIGIYLPIATTTPILLGGVLAWFVSRRASTALSRLPDAADREERRERHDRHGVLFASGLVAGEAIMGIVVAGLILFEPTDALGNTGRVVTGLLAPAVLGILAAAGAAVFVRGRLRWVAAGLPAVLGLAWTAAAFRDGSAYAFTGGASWPGFVLLAYVALLVVYVPLRELRERGEATAGEPGGAAVAGGK